MSIESLSNRKILKDLLEMLPDSPGVYIFQGEDGEVLYVGKALSLKKRVMSYFQSLENQPLKIQALMDQVIEFEFIVTESEHRALLLESSLIKEYEPRYNVRLKDHKSFPYIKVTVTDEYPRVFVTRQVQEDGSRYFGPFTDVKAARKSVRLLRGAFPIRSYCRLNGKLCLDYHIGKCSGPCGGKISVDDYGKLVDQIIRFLDGNGETLLQEFEDQMQQLSENLDFERAAVLRDRIKALTKTLEQHSIASPFIRDRDVIAFARSENRACAQIFFRRDGRIIGRQNLFLEGVDGESDNELMATIIKQYYADSTYIPATLVLQYPPLEKKPITQWLSQKRGENVTLMAPTSGRVREFIQNAERNAKLVLKHYLLKLEKEREMTEGALDTLQTFLEIPHPITRIEAFDISNIAGTAATGSMVVFENGKPKNMEYRHYKIQTVSKPDDVAMMTELLRRRYLTVSQKAKTDQLTPDLIVVDGGKGQLNAAVKVLEEAKLQIPVIGLAKRFEHIFVPEQSNPKILSEDSTALYLLQRIRDEAHRFAIRYHHVLQEQKLDKSALDMIKGIGEKRKRLLLQYFGSVDRIRVATQKDLTQVPGIDKKIARIIFLHFKNLESD